MASGAAGLKLLLIRDAFGHDGGATRFLALAETLRRRGGAPRIVSGPGPLDERAAAAGELELVDWPDRPGLEALRILERAAQGQDAIVVDCLPVNLPMVPALARRVPVHLCVHATPAVLAEDFGGQSSLPALGSVLAGLHWSGRVALTAASELEASEHERILGLPAGALTPSPNGVEAPADDVAPSAGPIRSVAVVSRLVDVKLPHVIAAAELVAAGGAAGRDVVLDVHGAGPSEAAAVAAIEARLPRGAWRLHGATDEPLEAMRRADVVVGGGRTCLEALALGRRVVVTRSVRGGDGEQELLPGGSGQLGAPVTPATLDVHVADNFRWSAEPPVEAEIAWRELESLSPEDVGRVRDRVHRELSTDAMLGRELELLDDLHARPQDHRQLLVATAEYAAELGRALVRARHERSVVEHRHRRAKERLAQRRARDRRQRR